MWQLWWPWCRRYKSSSTKLHGILPAPHRAIRHSVNVRVARGVSVVVAVNRGTLAIRAPCSLWKMSMRWWSSSPHSARTVRPPDRVTIPRHGGIK
jgi:hypothetical protein